MACEQCDSGLIRQSIWLDATGEQRANWRANNCAVVAGRGLCRNCYQRRYRRNLGCVS